MAQVTRPESDGSRKRGLDQKPLQIGRWAPASRRPTAILPLDLSGAAAPNRR
jgi:hypothetical protein